MVLHIDRAATRFAPAAGASAALRTHFDRHHWIRLPGLIAGSLLGDVQRGIASATFVDVRHATGSVDVCMAPNAASALMELVANDPPVLRAVETLTGCAPLVRFNGSVYRMMAGADHHHAWHNDLLHARRVAISVNLGPEAYEGGMLQLRVRETAEVIEEVANTAPGDALLFRIDAALQHRVLPVTRGVKTAFAGWFRSASPLREALRKGHL